MARRRRITDRHACSPTATGDSKDPLASSTKRHLGENHLKVQNAIALATLQYASVTPDRHHAVNNVVATYIATETSLTSPNVSQALTSPCLGSQVDFRPRENREPARKSTRDLALRPSQVLNHGKDPVKGNNREPHSGSTLLECFRSSEAKRSYKQIHVCLGTSIESSSKLLRNGPTTASWVTI